MTGSFHLAKGPDGSSVLQHMSESPPLLKAEYNSIMDMPHFIYPFIHQWTPGLFSILWRLWIMLLRTRIYRYLSPHFHYLKKKNQNSCKTSPQWINYQKVKDEIRSSTVLSCRRAGGKGKDGWHSPCVILLVVPPKILCPRWVPHSLHLHPGLVGMKGAWLSTLGQETPFPPTPSSHGWFRNQSDGAAFKLESWSWGFLSPRIDSS